MLQKYFDSFFLQIFCGWELIFCFEIFGASFNKIDSKSQNFYDQMNKLVVVNYSGQVRDTRADPGIVYYFHGRPPETLCAAGKGSNPSAVLRRKDFECPHH